MVAKSSAGVSTPIKERSRDALVALGNLGTSYGSSPEELRNQDVCNTSTESISPNRRESDTGSASPVVDQADVLPEQTHQKPSSSYIALISQAILKSPEKKLLLGDIYQYIMDTFPYYRNSGDKAWRNSIRHNLSLNECFIKAGRADSCKGNYWSIHEACQDDFSKGDYRRRQARRRARRHQVNISSLPLSYRQNIAYVPMTTMPTGGSRAPIPGRPPPYAGPTSFHPYSYRTGSAAQANRTPSPVQQRVTRSPASEIRPLTPLGGTYGQTAGPLSTYRQISPQDGACEPTQPQVHPRNPLGGSIQAGSATQPGSSYRDYSAPSFAPSNFASPGFYNITPTSGAGHFLPNSQVAGVEGFVLTFGDMPALRDALNLF